MFNYLDTNFDNEEMITKIQYVYDEIYSIWNDIKFDETSKIRDAWNDEAGKLYIDKLLEIDSQVNLILNKLETLRDCYIKYKHKIEEEQ